MSPVGTHPLGCTQLSLAKSTNKRPPVAGPVLLPGGKEEAGDPVAWEMGTLSASGNENAVDSGR